MNLHDLANAPGFGYADKVLTAAGHPREKSGGNTFEVTIEWAACYSTTMTVEAETEAEARNVARQMVRECPNDGDLDCVEIGKTAIGGEAIYG